MAFKILALAQMSRAFQSITTLALRQGRGDYPGDDDSEVGTSNPATCRWAKSLASPIPGGFQSPPQAGAVGLFSAAAPQLFLWPFH